MLDTVHKKLSPRIPLRHLPKRIIGLEPMTIRSRMLYPTELYSLCSVFPECHKNVTMIDVKTVTNCNVDIQSLLKGTNTPT